MRVESRGNRRRREPFARRDRNDAFSGVVAAGFAPVNLSGRGEPEQVFGQVVSGNYFDVLGAPFALGRGFVSSEDERPGASPVVVLTDGLWQRRVGGRSDIIGDTIAINGRQFTVVGVTADGFRGTTTLGGPELWVPLAMYKEIFTGFFLENWDSRRALLFQITGRLKDGVSIEQAQANMAALGKSLEQAFPTDNRGRSISVVPLAEATIFTPAFHRDFVIAGGMLMAIVGVVLLIACGNDAVRLRRTA